jgi:peptidoglycan/xylan/chitin deacetylase (PgdA/CDA1 family)
VRGLLDALRRRIRPAPPRPVVLMYHRVADPPVDPWGLAVRPRHFQEQLEVIGRTRRPLPLSDFVRQLERRTLPSNAVAITFDDGYADNLHQARPRLEEADVPATLFLATGTVGQRSEYWWDELARMILCRAEPLDCEIEIEGEPHRLSIQGTGPPPASARAWRAWEDAPSGREAGYLAVWRRLRLLPAPARDEAMSRLRAALKPPPPDPADFPMTEHEVAELVAAGGVFEIGGHTVTHPVLPALDPAQRRREILDGRRACERLARRAPAGFAYPHGACDADSRAAVAECGFAWACSTEARPVSLRGYDLYMLPRIAALDCNGEAFDRALRAAEGRADG